jgi:hypothetical protein
VGQKLGGDYRTFIDLMNKRAKELGCTDTHFNNCNGLPDEDHWVSAYDMALISAEAYKNETFRMIASIFALFERFKKTCPSCDCISFVSSHENAFYHFFSFLSDDGSHKNYHMPVLPETTEPLLRQ